MTEAVVVIYLICPLASPHSIRDMRRRSAHGKYSALAILLIVVVGPQISAAEELTTPPVRYAVMAFENRSEIQSIEWMRVAVPFVLAEKLEAHRSVQPLYDSLVLPKAPPPALIDDRSVAEFAASQQVELVFTGSVDRAENWDLVIEFRLWRVMGGVAEVVGEHRQRGDFGDVNAITADAIAELCDSAGLTLHKLDRAEVAEVVTTDHYAFTLFGRGLLSLRPLRGRPDLDRAHKNLAKSVYIDPQLAAAQRLLAEVHLRQNKRGKARGRLSYALELKPNYFAALAAMARLAYQDGKLDDARDLTERMLERRPWDIDIRFFLGELLWELGDTDASYEALKRVVRSLPNHLPARRILVLIHATRGDGADLVSELESVAALDPEDVLTQIDLGAAYAAVGREDKAIATYNDIIRKQPRHVQALKFVGDLHRKRGELDQAIAHYRRALKAASSDPRFYFLLGRVYVESGDDRSAKAIYRRAQKFPKYMAEVYNNLGAIALREESRGEALWYFRRAVRKRPTSARFRYNYALTLSSLRRANQALEQIQAGLAADSKHVELNYLHGVVLLRTGDADGAKAAFERTLQLDPDHEDAGHNLIILQKMERRTKEGEIATELPDSP